MSLPVTKTLWINTGGAKMPDPVQPADLPSLEITDQASVAVQKTPNRVSLESLVAKIRFVDYIFPERHPHMTLCLVTLENGYIVVGKTAPADPENFNAELGMRFAKEDAVRQIWPLEAYLLREKMRPRKDGNGET
jgi:hypothetical protein